MQEILSKMVYNQGRSLAALERWDDAVDAALARREIWQSDGERLFGVAVELAGIGRAVAAQKEGNAESRERIDRETVATLRQALKQGLSRDHEIAHDKRFAHLQENTEFNELLAEHSR